VERKMRPQHLLPVRRIYRDAVRHLDVVLRR